MLASTAGHAFTLGELRGSAVLGQPLEVSVSVSTADGEAVSNDCLSAEMLFGDFQQRAPSLRVQNTTNGVASASLVRIRSSAVVSEPVVTVVLRATCGSSTSRRYVLLSDFPALDLPSTDPLPDTAPAAVTVPGAKTPLQVTDLQALPGSVTPVAAQALRPTSAAKPKPKAAKVPRNRAVEVAKSWPAIPAAAATPAQPAPDAVSDTGRLVLKLDSELVILNPAELAELAALRASLPKMASEGEVLKQSLQLDALQNDLKAFKDLTNKNQNTLAELQVKLSQADAERISMVWLYLLGGLLAAALAALAWVLRQQQSAKAVWWQQAESDTVATLGPVTRIEPTEPAPMSSPVPESTRPPAAATPEVPATPLERQSPDLDLDFDLDQLGNTPEPSPDTFVQAATRSNPLGISLDLNSETVADIRQQAEFFVSLGQAPRAINLLHRHIRESVEPHPMVYLDLLTLYHSQGMKAEFRELRLDFSRLFNAIVPDFPAYYQEGRSLLDYPEQLSELVRAWPNWDAVALLDACIFRRDLSSPNVGFDLAAFRDLLLLRTLVDKVKTGEPNPLAKPFVLKEPLTSSKTVSAMGLVNDDSDTSLAQANLPADLSLPLPTSNTLAQTNWLAPQAVPTTEELETEFPIDMFDTVKKPEA